MLRFSRSKIIATVAIIVIGLLLAVPSTMNHEQRQAYLNAIPSWVPSWLVPSRAIVLGLDLQGGSHVLLEVDSQDLLRGQITLLRSEEHTSELQSRQYLVCRLLLEKKKEYNNFI